MTLLPIHDPLALVAILLLIEGGILLLADWKGLGWLFKYLPSMFWIYFLPMIANTVGLIPTESPIYDGINQYFLPASLILLLISVDVIAIGKLGPRALTVMLAGSVGILLGGPIIVLIFKHWLPADSWQGIGILSASWIGGSANMLAVKEAKGVSDKLYSTMIVVDTICPYAWMAFMILLSSYQQRIDKALKADVKWIDELSAKYQDSKQLQKPIALKHIVLMFSLAALGTWGCIWTAKNMGNSEFLASLQPYRFISMKGWPILFATTLGILLSFTPIRKLESYGASKVGYAMLYLVLATIGAKAGLVSLKQAPMLIVAGFAWIFLHAVAILVAGRVLRTPVSVMAAASQANIGGPASAPVLAGIYQPGLAAVGLLMAVLGNILGTYLGLLCFELCRWVS